MSMKMTAGCHKSVVLFSSGDCRAPFVATLSAQACSAASAEID
jgi:hypothetical protein